jgi:hypothetical protein
MGWARNYYSYDLTNWKDQVQRGYSYKLCPYSTAYRDKFRYEGTVCTGIALSGATQNITGIFVIGNSNNAAFYAKPYDAYECSEHTTTSGRMIPVSNPPGWMCDDPSCFYHTNIDSDRWYREV